MQHHVDRRVGARRVYLGDLVDGQHRVEHDGRLVVRLAEGRHQNRLVRLLPAAGERREHKAAGLGTAGAREMRALRRGSMRSLEVFCD